MASIGSSLSVLPTHCVWILFQDFGSTAERASGLNRCPWRGHFIQHRFGLGPELRRNFLLLFLSLNFSVEKQLPFFSWTVSRFSELDTMTYVPVSSALRN